MRAPYPRSDLPTSPDWRDRAQCREDDPRLYESTDPQDIADAKWVCLNLCPVASECLEEALETERRPEHQRAMVRGGLTAEERSKLRPRRRA